MSLHTPRTAATTARLAFNADVAAIVIALALAALVRFNVIHHITW
jgi:hypothetical protein